MRGLMLHPTGIELRPNDTRVLVRPFIPSDSARIVNILGRALSMSEEETEEQVAQTIADFSARHQDLTTAWMRHFHRIEPHLFTGRTLSETRKLYLGALFSGEYALESAALFNPSIVPHPDQSHLGEDELRFILSLRATGEGHISSVEFRAGVVHADYRVTIETPSRFVSAPARNPDPTYKKRVFLHKLMEMGFENVWSTAVMKALKPDFSLSELETAMREVARDHEPLTREIQRTTECIRWLAESNYEVHFPQGSVVSERIIFPVSSNESNGMEDARFVRFVEEDGSVIYYATYTAYNGRAILPQLLETSDFLNFRARTLNGHAVQNKGMAFFPRRIDGRYAMISRQDDENLFLMFSDNPHFWSEPHLLRRPRQAWEFVKIGNCGSPIETDQGWLVITHGVGPMRKYSLGVILLDLHDPRKVIAELREPLIQTGEVEREGYVPNVVYTCGALVHRNRLVLPYGLSDTTTKMVTVELEELFAALIPV